MEGKGNRKRLTERDEFGNADIIGVDGMDLQCSLEFYEFNKVANALNKLAEYEDLEEQGKLLKLPISPKTPIYSIEYCCGKNSDNKSGLCYKGRCEECESKSYCILEATAESSCKIIEIGKSVFLTKEAAEAALKEMSE